MKEKDLKRFMGKVQIDTEPGTCWRWTAALNKDGYGWFELNCKMHLAHRVMLEHKLNTSLKGLCACHTCDVRRCVNPDHLYAGTHIDNMRDRGERGRLPNRHGEKAPSAKLTDEQALKIITDKATASQELAKLYNVSLTTIYRVRAGETFRHLPR